MISYIEDSLLVGQGEVMIPVRKEKTVTINKTANYGWISKFKVSMEVP